MIDRIKVIKVCIGRIYIRVRSGASFKDIELAKGQAMELLKTHPEYQVLCQQTGRILLRKRPGDDRLIVFASPGDRKMVQLASHRTHKADIARICVDCLRSFRISPHPGARTKVRCSICGKKRQAEQTKDWSKHNKKHSPDPSFRDRREIKDLVKRNKALAEAWLRKTKLETLTAKGKGIG